MSDVEIRPAQQADLEALVGTFADEDFFVNRLARQQADQGVLLTAWVENTPIGDVYLWLQPADEPEVREHLPGVPLLNHVEVHADHRNRGIGTELVLAAEKLLAERGYDQVALAVRTDNDHAKRLYERLGYEIWPHSEVECVYEFRLPDGTRARGTETCDMLVKQLHDRRA
ncbi:MAG: GNAT family N-acetyltransferase [Kibdelosporangium sp.]